MRTTIEMANEHRAALLELAARRGEKGFSRLVAEALDQYLGVRRRGDERPRNPGLALRGSLGKAEAEALSEAVAVVRKSWR